MAKQYPIKFTDGYQLVQGPNGHVSVQSTEDEGCFYSIELFLRGKWSPFSAEQKVALQRALA